MSQLKILIVEDEMIIGARISLHLTQLGYEVTGIIPRGEEALIHCKENKPDILLLDINLKGSIDGIETATQLQKEMDIPIIYLTANADEATFQRAKSTRPYAFISKPYNKVDLERAIELTVSRMDPSATYDIENTESNFSLTDRIFVKHKDRMVKLLLADILYIEAERSYCRIMTNEQEYLISSPLKTLEKKLPEGPFFRIHRSYVINLEKLDEISDTHVVIQTKIIPISKSYKEAFEQRVNRI